jgi:hypothetical protein
MRIRGGVSIFFMTIQSLHGAAQMRGAESQGFYDLFG